uniref:Uncharacterized protein n=1 Tax=Chromera velia CCMP2878 TaxID=1169474 RepID=A0A0G4HVH3_9ALVE|eukprot:Cvel_8859.t1-p1 / transcript=Cvel_8859.t1 / gene=Cvel_8859 / organism=Chromera_velia_CCMP2878 / gene_product=hypothetical protein / transcript_product=hypothetical protein / location=Cvel_scaffold498:22006-24441(+) / protein_length=660 / sequence_SO=supercontig / SO=protein_coding / is_pseudo=false
MVLNDSRLLFDIPNLLIRSGVLGVRQFWKFSSISKDLLRVRDDPTSLGFGSVCSGFHLTRERGEVSDLLYDCLDADNAVAFRQVLALGGWIAQVPFLLHYALEQEAQKCVNVLTKMTVALVCRELSPHAVSVLTSESLDGLLKAGIVRPDSWIQLDDPGVRECTEQPLLTALIDARNFECAEMLLDAGARVDTVEWELKTDWVGRAPLHALVLQLGASGQPRCDVVERDGEVLRLSERERETGLSLLRRLAIASKASGCLDWETSVWMRKGWECTCAHAPGVSCSCKWSMIVSREETALGLACVARQADAVRILLEAGAETSRGRGEAQGYKQHNKLSLPMLAVARDWLSPQFDDARSAEVLAVLADWGVDLNKRGAASEVREEMMGHTPLSFACAFRLQKCVEVWADKGVNAKCALPPRALKGSDESVCLPLTEALASPGYGREALQSVVKSLLKAGADPNDAAYVKSFQNFQSQPQKVFCLTGGASPNGNAGVSTVTRPTKTPLLELLNEYTAVLFPVLPAAPFSVRNRLVRLLLEKGADPNLIGQTLLPGFQGSWAVAPLQMALFSAPKYITPTKEEKSEMAKLLIEHGAHCPFSSSAHQIATVPDATPAGPMFKASPLLMACETLDCDLLRLLCTRGGGRSECLGDREVRRHVSRA